MGRFAKTANKPRKGRKKLIPDVFRVEGHPSSRVRSRDNWLLGFSLLLESGLCGRSIEELVAITATRWSMLMIEDEVLREFETWFESEAIGDPSYFASVTPQLLISRAAAISDKCVDELLNLSRRGVGLRDWITINLVPLDSGNRFPTVRRKGGDDDRGFSPALNAEMRKRHGSGE